MVSRSMVLVHYEWSELYIMMLLRKLVGNRIWYATNSIVVRQVPTSGHHVFYKNLYMGMDSFSDIVEDPF